MSDATVKLILSLHGENKAGAALAQAEKQAQSLGSRMSAVAEKSGDVERGFLGLKDIAANLSPQAQVIADVAGGLEGMVKGLGGLFGPIGAGIGLVAAAAAGVYAMVKANEQEVADKRAKYLDSLAEAPKYALAHLKLSQDLLATEKSNFDLAKARAELGKAATDAVKLEAQLTRDLADGKKAEVAAGRIALAQARDRVALAAQEVRDAQQVALYRARDHAATIANEIALQVEAQRIAAISDTRLRLAEQERVARRSMLAIEAELATVRAEAVKAEVDAQIAIATGDLKRQEQAAERITKYANKVKELVGKQIAAQNELRSVEQSREQDAAQRQEKRQQRAAAAAAARQKAEQERARNEQESDRVSKEMADQLVERAQRYIRQIKTEIEWQRKRDEAYKQSQSDLAQAQIDAESDPAKRAELEYLEKRRVLKEQLITVEKDLRLEERTKANQEAALKLKMKTLDQQEAKRIEQEEKEKRDAKIQSAFAVADATISALGMVQGAEKVAAGMYQVLAIAKGLYAVTEKNVGGIPQLIAGMASAAQFALVSGQSAPSVPSIGGLTDGANQPQSLAPSGGMGGGGPVTINVQGAVIGTPQQVGMQVQKAAKSLKSTGYAAKAGA